MESIDIHVNAETNEAEYTQDLRKLRSRIIDIRTSAQAAFATLPKVISAPFKIGLNFIKSFGNLLKKTLIGGLLIFALSLQRLFQSLRESMGELISMRGGTLEKDVEETKYKFIELRAAIANAFLPLLEIALPYIKIVLDWLTKLFNRLAMIVAAFAGQKEVLQVTAGSAKKLADETKKTEKAARGALAAFDEINVLETPQATGAEETTPATVGAELVPITDDILSKVQNIKDEIAEWINDPFGKLQEIWTRIKEWFKTHIIDPISEWWHETWLKIGEAVEFWKEKLNIIKEYWKEKLDIIKEYWVNKFTEIVDFWKEKFNNIKDFWKEKLDAIKEYWMNTFTRIGDFWKEKLDNIKEYWKNTFAEIKDFMKGIINNIIDIINGMISGVVGGINAIINAANAIGDILPGYVPIEAVTPPQIPHLATGAVVPPNAEFAAILGDNKRENEILAPESTIRRIIQEELGNINTSVEIKFTGSGSELARMLKPVLDKENTRIGGSLVKSGITR